MRDGSKSPPQKIIVPVICLFIVSLYLIGNIRTGGVATLSGLLVGSSIITIIYSILNVRDVNEFFNVNIFAILLLFFTYEFVVGVLTLNSGHLSVPRLMDSNGGVLYKLFLGIVMGVNIKILFRHFRTTEEQKTSCKLLIPSYLLIMSTICVMILIEKMSYGLKDTVVLSINLDHMGYQRMGVMSIMLNMLCGMCLCGLVDRKLKIISLICYWTISICLSVLCILSLSNTGFVSNLVMMCATTGAFFYFSKRRYYLNVISDFIFKYGARYMMYLLILTIAAFMLFPQYIGSLRIFDVGENSSFLSRYNILVDNFWSQFSVSPLFGNLSVHKYFDKDGTYVHSLLSVVTHLGIIGMSLFLVLLYFSYRYAFLSAKNGSKYSFLLVIYLSIFIIICTITSFYTWVPLWISIVMMLFVNQAKETTV